MRAVEVSAIHSARLGTVVIYHVLLLLQVLYANGHFNRAPRLQVNRLNGHVINDPSDVLKNQDRVDLLRNIFQVHVWGVASLVASGNRRFVVVRGLRRTSAGAGTSITTDGHIRISRVVRLGVRVRAFSLSVFHRVYRALSRHHFQSNGLVVHVRPLSVLTDRNDRILVQRDRHFYYVKYYVRWFFDVSKFASSFGLDQGVRTSSNGWGR